MTDKKRLETIKELVKKIESVLYDEWRQQELIFLIESLYYIGHVDWLIQQAERVQELEEEIRRIRQMKYHEAYEQGKFDTNMKVWYEVPELEQQNKRYREALTFYAEKSNYDYDVKVDSIGYIGDQSDMKFYRLDSKILNDKGEKARQALEGESDA